MASVPAIREALAARLATIAGLRIYDFVPGQVNPPAAVVLPGDPLIEYDETMDGLDSYRFTIMVLVANPLERLGQDALDAYLARDGVSSIKAAIEAAERLGGLVSFTRVARVRNYGATEYAGSQYLAAEFDVEVGT